MNRRSFLAAIVAVPLAGYVSAPTPKYTHAHLTNGVYGVGGIIGIALEYIPKDGHGWVYVSTKLPSRVQAKSDLQVGH